MEFNQALVILSKLENKDLKYYSIDEVIYKKVGDSPFAWVAVGRIIR